MRMKTLATLTSCVHGRVNMTIMTIMTITITVCVTLFVTIIVCVTLFVHVTMMMTTARAK